MFVKTLMIRYKMKSVTGIPPTNVCVRIELTKAGLSSFYEEPIIGRKGMPVWGVCLYAALRAYEKSCNRDNGV